MSNLFEHAKRELDILCKSLPDPNNRPIVEEFIPEMLALIDKFGNSGQSGASAPLVAKAITKTLNKLMMFLPIRDLTGVEAEWQHTRDTEERIHVFQNKRCNALFKESENGESRYIEAVVFKEEGNGAFTSGYGALYGENKLIGSHLYIKEFPFNPKTFYVDVVKTNIISENDYDWRVKDESQLIPIFEYYDNPLNIRELKKWVQN